MSAPRALVLPSVISRQCALFSIQGIGLQFPIRKYSKFHPRHAHPRPSNQTLSPITTPPIFHDYLRLASSNNTLLLLLFTTSACVPCTTISPLLQSLVTSRTPSPTDRFSAVSFAEVELDSPDRSNGAVSDLAVEYGISSIPTLVGFGGRRAERVTERVVDTRMMSSKDRMRAWLDEWVEKGDPFGVDSRDGSTGTGGLLGKLFGGN
jgi:thiol-disulfide isomerase/thioredoxin